MNEIQVKLTRIGNSKGIRIPASILGKYGIKDTLILEQRPDEIVLKPHDEPKLSWNETFNQMARENEDWSDLQAVIGDGLD